MSVGTKVYICFDLKKNDAVSIHGHVFFDSVLPIEDYINSGSEWITPEDLEPRPCVVLGLLFQAYMPPVPSEAPETLLGALPEP